MTLYELSLEYEQAADLLRERISQLERARREVEDEQRKVELNGRLRPLRAMYRETRAVARHLEGYYHKFTPNRTRRLSGRSLYPLDHRRRI